MEMALLVLISFAVLAMISIVTVLFLLQSTKNKKIKKQLDRLEIAKNELDSSPVIPELSKIESINKNEKLEAMYDNWKSRLNSIREEQVPKITDMLLEADYSLQKQDYKGTLYKIARLEMEIYKVRTNSEFLLKEIKEITTSEERSRALITTLKTKYRELYQKFTNSKADFGDIVPVIELQFENIAKRFEVFENVMDQNEYTEVSNIIKSIDDMLKHMEIVLEEMPSIWMIANSILPKKIDDIMDEYNHMIKKSYPLDYLNVENNVSEALNKIKDITEKSKVLNIEDSLVELKVLVEYFDSLFNDFEKEKVDRHEYDDANRIFKQKYEKINGIVNEIFIQLDSIKDDYNFSKDDIIELKSIHNELVRLNEDYTLFMEHTGNNTFAYSKLIKELELLTRRLSSLEERVDIVLDSIGNMKEDEVRARQQLEEIKVVLKKAKTRIREFDLPVIPKNYYVELNDAQRAIKEIIRELDKKPISIDVLNTRVDTARDLVLKLFGTTKEMVKTAMFAEMAIVYGNRYRSDVNDLNKYLNYAEKLFFDGEYKKSLETSINSLNKVEAGIYDKLLELYSDDN